MRISRESESEFVFAAVGGCVRFSPPYLHFAVISLALIQTRKLNITPPARPRGSQPQGWGIQKSTALFIYQIHGLIRTTSLPPRTLKSMSRVFPKCSQNLCVDYNNLRIGLSESY